MNQDTPDTVGIQQVEQGLRTLTHDWRNVLNGINLRISSAKYAESDDEWESDLEEAHQLIVAATGQLSALGRKIAPPTVTAIPYPVDFFLEDMAAYVSQHLGENALKLQWEKSLVPGKVELDFALISQAMIELIENSLRRLSADEKISISTIEDGKFLSLFWNEKYQGASAPETWGHQPFSSSERGHMGLGLYFARRVLAAHRGTIHFEHNALNRMLQTTVRIPMQLS